MAYTTDSLSSIKSDLIHDGDNAHILSNFMKAHKTTTLTEGGKIFKASTANIEFLKIGMFILANKQKYKDIKVEDISVFSFSHEEPEVNSLNRVFENLKVLMKYGDQDLKLSKLSEDKDFDHKLYQASDVNLYLKWFEDNRNNNDIIKSNKISSYEEIAKAIRENDKQLVYKLEDLLMDRMRDRSEGKSTQDKYNDEDIQMISKMILELHNIDIPLDTRLQAYGAVLNENTAFRSSRDSVNAVRTALHNIIMSAHNAVRQRYVSFDEKHRKVYDKIIQNPLSVTDRVLGKTMNYFVNLFEDKEKLILKKTSDPTLNREEREYLKFYYDYMIPAFDAIYSVKSTNMQKIYANEKDDIVRQLPLFYAESFEKLITSGDPFGAMKRFVEDLTRFNEETPGDEEYIKRNSERIQMFNAFERSITDKKYREEQLEEAKTGDFSSDVEKVLSVFAIADFKKQEMNKIMPTLHSFRTFVNMAGATNNKDIKNLATSVEQEIQMRVFGTDPKLFESETLNKSLRGIKKISSMGQILFNPMTGFVQGVNGMFVNISATFAEQFKKDPRFSFKDLQKASMVMLRDTPKSVYTVSFIEKMGYALGANNMDISLMRKTIKTNPGLTGFANDLSQWFANYPDYANRMTLMMAQMNKEGILKIDALGNISEDSAWTLDKNGNLEYDETKDIRFKILYDPNANKNSEAYKKALARRKLVDDQLSQETDGLKDETVSIDGKTFRKMNRPYFAKEIRDMKQFSDDNFGAYDRDTKSWFERTALGGLLMQFRTWLKSIAKRWYYESNAMSDLGKVEFVKDPETGEYYARWKGGFNEGIFQTVSFLFNEIKDSGKIVESYKKLDPDRKAILMRAISDLLLFMMATLATKTGMAIAKENIKEGKSNSVYTYNLLKYTNYAVSDLFVWNNITSVVNDDMPIISISTVTDLTSKWFETLTGDRELSNSIMTSFGATRWLYHTMKDLKEAQGQ